MLVSSFKNPRLNVTLEDTTVSFLTKMAHTANKSVACIARELIHEALEMREDLYLSKLAETLDVKNEKTYSHTEAWL